MWHLYLIRCDDGALYTGITTDVQRRLQEHRRNRGARRLRGRGPLELVFAQAVGDRGLALRLESAVKRWSKARKERLVGGQIRLLDEPPVRPAQPAACRSRPSRNSSARPRSPESV